MYQLPRNAVPTGWTPLETKVLKIAIKEYNNNYGTILDDEVYGYFLFRRTGVNLKDKANLLRKRGLLSTDETKENLVDLIKFLTKKDSQILKQQQQQQQQHPNNMEENE